MGGDFIDVILVREASKSTIIYKTTQQYMLGRPCYRGPNPSVTHFYRELQSSLTIKKTENFSLPKILKHFSHSWAGFLTGQRAVGGPRGAHDGTFKSVVLGTLHKGWN